MVLKVMTGCINKFGGVFYLSLSFCALFDGDSFDVFHVSLKMEEDGDLPKTLVKLRRTPSDTPRPASTPPVIAASAIQDEDDEEKIIAELEVRPLT